MIEQVTVKNFQSLEDITLKFGQFTVITGPTNSGKSAFIRAVKAAVTNRSGDDFIRHGVNSTEVEISTGESVVKWIKGKKKSGVYDIDGEIIEKTGRAVPDRVTESLSIFPLQAEGTEIWPQIDSQFDSPLLLSIPASQTARIISKLINLDPVLNAQVLCSRDLKSKEQEIKNLKATIDENREKLSSMEWIEETSEEWDRLSDEGIDWHDLVEVINSSLNLFSEYKEASVLGAPEILEDIETCQKKLQEFLTVLDIYKETNSHYNLFMQYKNRLEDTYKKIETTEKELKERSLILKEMIDHMDTCPFCGQVMNV